MHVYTSHAMTSMHKTRCIWNCQAKALLLQAFEAFDADGDGKMSTAELRVLLRDMGARLTKVGHLRAVGEPLESR